MTKMLRMLVPPRLFSSSGEILLLQRQRAHALANRCKNCIAERGCDHRDRRLADTAPEPATRNENAFNLRHLRDPQHGIVVKIGLLNASILDRDLSVERSSEP